MIVATNDMGDCHIVIVNHHAKIIGRCAIRARDDEIVEFRIGKFDTTFDLIVPSHYTVKRIAKAYHRRDALGRGRQDLARFGSPTPVVARLFLTHFLLGAQRSQLVYRHIATVGTASRQHLLNHHVIAIHPLYLVIRTLIVIQFQPGHPVDNRLHRFWCRARHIRIFNAQNELPAMMPCKGPRKKRRARAADMQKPGRTRGESCANSHEDHANKFVERRSLSSMVCSRLTASAPANKIMPLSRAVNSAVECHLHTVEATGSIPVPPTKT